MYFFVKTKFTLCLNRVFCTNSTHKKISNLPKKIIFFSKNIEFSQNKKWEKLQKINEIFITGWPKSRVGELGQLLSFSKLMKDLIFLTEWTAWSTSAQRPAAGRKFCPKNWQKMKMEKLLRLTCSQWRQLMVRHF